MKIFATDLDGTLLKPGSIIDESVENSIKKLKENNFNIIAVSGRVSSSIRYFMNKLNINSYIIGNNGAIVLDKNDNIVYNKSLTKDNLVEIFNIADKYNINIRMYGKDTYYSKFLEDDQVNHMKISEDNYAVNFEIRDDFKEFVLENNIDIFKVLLDTNQKDYGKFYEELKKNENLYITKSGQTNLDISRKEVNKFDALEYLLDNEFSNESKKLFTIGDYFNDIEMIQNADFGIAMGNACDDLKNIADYITDDVKDNGFEKAVDYIIEKK